MTELSYGRDVLGDAERAARLEWIVTNGIGGYAAGTAAGILTRRYHGLLVAALEPPVGRTLLLAKLAEQIAIDGAIHELDTNRWADGTLAPRGLVHLESFRLEAGVPAWTWAIGDTRLEKRVWMEHGENTTCIQYRLAAAGAPVTLGVRALVDHRDAHHVTSRGETAARIEPATGGVKIQVREDAAPLWLLAPGAAIEPQHDWYRGFALALEQERGLEPQEDLLCAARLTVKLSPGDTFMLIASTRHDAAARGGPLGLATALARRHAHEKSLMAMWAAASPRAARAAPSWIGQLVLAADAFVVERAVTSDLNGRSIIAGYPWFADWGRDTMIALPGLTLATGRPEIARAVIATYARHLDQGMLPNRFPDHGHAPEYTSADAALWFFQAVRATFEVTGDEAWLAGLYPALEEIGAWLETGTRYGIGIDPADGLVRIGENDRLALTWMDARVDGRAVTPRRGKPVEINALWHGALVAMAGFATRLKRPAEPYELLARRVEHSFERFWNAEAGCLYDVIDSPDGADASIRPNQLFAVALPESPLPPLRRRAVLETCGRRLLTSHGLRSLAPDDPRYRGRYLGAPAERDQAYHQGTAWTWLLPVYALGHFRVHGDRDAALALLDPFAQLIGELGVGSLPEIADGDPPYTPRGCFAQAWSVGEALRVWHLLAAPASAAAATSRAPRGKVLSRPAPSDEMDSLRGG